MKDKTRNIIIGAIVVIVIVILFFLIRGAMTGNAVKTLNTGDLDVNVGISVDFVDIYVDNKFITTIKRGDQDEYISLEAGKHQLRAETTGQDDWEETITIEAGKTTTVYPWFAGQKTRIS